MGDDIEVYADVSRSSVLTVFHTLRQQMEKAPGHYHWGSRNWYPSQRAWKII